MTVSEQNSESICRRFSDLSLDEQEKLSQDFIEKNQISQEEKEEIRKSIKFISGKKDTIKYVGINYRDSVGSE